jgi:peptide/nickel transport system substrate-binding protein
LHRAHLRLVLGVVIAGIGLIVAGAAGGTPAKTTAGTVVFGAEQEPPCLNGALEGCNNTWTAWTAGVALPGAYIVRPNFTFQPYMVSKTDVKKKPFSITFHIKPKARWSDGRQVTADDFIFTWRLFVDPNNEVAGRSGYDSITRAKAINSKTVRFTFRQPYAPYKTIFGAIYPKHALQGQNFNEVWNNNFNKPGTNVTMASGPYKIQSYTKGQSLTMVRNPTFWGARPSVDRIVFRFITVTDSEIQAIRGGEVDAIYPQPQLQLAALRGQAGLRTQTNAGASLEHIDMNMGARNGNPLLRQKWFREAITYSLDRGAMVRQLFRTLNPGLRPLNNLSFTSQQRPYYVPHFAKYTRNLTRVNALFRAHGCTKGGDGIYSCGGQRASVRLGTTSGNRLRELAVEILLAQAKAGGIEFRPDNQPSRLFFPRLSEENYDLALFAWVGTGDPAGQTDIYGIGGGSNWKGYRNSQVTSLLRRSDATLDVKARMALVNRADAILANDLVTIPLYQKPTYFVYKTKLRGLVDNPTLQGPTWNVEHWRAG